LVKQFRQDRQAIPGTGTFAFNMLRLTFSVAFVPLVVSYCPTVSMWSTMTKENCESHGCKCSEFFNDPSKCTSCGECLDATDCLQSSHPVCKGPASSYGSMCVECMVNSDCTSSSKPACNGLTCKPTCGTTNYHCKTGMRVDALNDHACVGGECVDRDCCGECSGDDDCTDPSSPRCQSSPYEPSKCKECASNDHCGDGKSVCFSGKCSACQDGEFTCSGPCVAGRFECELPCTQDSDCRTNDGEICAVNPGESEVTSGAKRCQRPCSSNQGCEDPVFSDVLHTCLESDGRKFCGQCLEDSHCSTGQTCQQTKHNTGQCTESLAV